MQSYEVRLPVTLELGVLKPKKISLNLNWYRNAHFYDKNNAKKAFLEQVEESLKDIPKLKKIHIHYSLYLRTKRKCDIMNIISIVDKFFCDTLQEKSIIDDDNYTVIPLISGKYAGFTNKDEKEDSYIIASIVDIS